MSRLYDPEPPITVEADNEGRPAAVVWDRTKPVREVTNRWHVDHDWWRVPISRTNCTVRTPTALLEVYSDERSGDWYLQWVID